MSDIELSGHARRMLEERGIAEEWVWRTVPAPDRAELAADGTTHYIKAVPEHGGRFLRVVVSRSALPERVVTVFFDRPLRRNP